MEAIEDGSYFEDRQHASSPTLREVTDDYLDVAKREHSHTTVADYKCRLGRWILPLVGDEPVSKINRTHFDEIRKEIEDEGNSLKTVRNVLSILSSMLTYCQDCDLIDETPTYEVSDNRSGKRVGGSPSKLRGKRTNTTGNDSRPPYLTPAQAVALLENAHPRVRLLILIALQTGLRLGEMLALGWEHIKLDQKVLEVRWSFSKGKLKEPKSAAGVRDIPIPPKLEEELRKYRRNWKSTGEYEGAHDWLFQRDDGRLWSDSYVKRPIRYSYRDAGLWDDFKRHGFTILRHTFATTLVNRGVPLVIVQRLMGHERFETTLKYVERDPATHRKAIDQIADLGFSENDRNWQTASSIQS